MVIGADQIKPGLKIGDGRGKYGANMNIEANLPDNRIQALKSQELRAGMA